MNPEQQPATSAYLRYLDNWMEQLPSLKLADLGNSPAEIALVTVDVIKGFCQIGPLASPRINAIVEPITDLMKAAWDYGVDKIVLTQDAHEPDAVEFGAWPPHCIRGTAEAETVAAISELPFADQIILFRKNSIASGMSPEFAAWVAGHPEVKTFIVLGDCSDLCTYQLAMFLRLDANENQLERRVLVPADCVDTYDMPLDTAQEIGAFPHPGDFLHSVFLNHMALNGVEVVRSIS